MAVFVFAVCVLWAAVCATNGIAESGHPNVLFLVVDDLRPKLGCYGEDIMVTPNIDQLATKSVRFQWAYVQQALCSPSRTSFLTGRRPDTTRVFDLNHYFRHVAGNYTTLPQHFKNGGYITQSVGKIFHPGAASGNTDDYPYSWTYPAFHAPTENFTSKKICPEPGSGHLTHSAVCPVDLKTVPGGSLPDIQNTDFSIEFLKNRSLDHKPFFLGMGYHRPHLPFAFPKEYLDLYPMSKIGLAPNPYYPPWLPKVAWSPYGELRKYHDIQALNISWPFGLVPVDYQYKLRQSYSAATSYTDAQVGRVLKALDDYGLADNTIITFHGDHGWQLGDHGEWCKHTNFDIATRIPLLIHVPGVTAKKAPPGKSFPFHDALDRSLRFRPDKSEEEAAAPPALSSDALVEAVDLFATVSELAGLEVPPTCPNTSFHLALCTEGSSMVPIIKNLTTTTTTTSSTPGRDVTHESTTSSGHDVTTEGRMTSSGHGVITEGRMTSSGRDVSKGPMKWKSAVFSQYPRHTLVPGSRVETQVMGYTMRTYEYRYTEWIAYDFHHYKADWRTVYARELYIYATDPDEDLNVAEVPAFQELARSLSRQLRNGWRKALPNP